MARSKLPDPLSRRHLLEGTLEPAKALAVAQAYLEADRELDAIDFLGRAEARDALAELQEKALERGDVFLMRAASAALGDEPESATWLRLAEAARGAGRERDAETAQRLATVRD